MDGKQLRHRLTFASLKRTVAAVTLAVWAVNTLAMEGALTLPAAIRNVFQLEQVHAAAGINKIINYQGKVSAINGAAVGNGSYNMRFKIYDAASGGNVLWSENWTSSTTRVTMTGGLFSVGLGTHVTMTGSVNFNTDNLYLQVEFDPGNDGTFEETFSPRRRFGSVPYAFNTDTIDGLDSTQFLRKDLAQTTTGSILFSTGGTAIRVRGAISGAILHVTNSLTSSGTLAVDGDVSFRNYTSCSIITTDANGNLGCDTGTVITSTTGDARYIKKSGDTMTGALNIRVTGGNNGTLSLNAAGTISGAILKAAKTLASSGALVWEGAASGSSLYVATSINGAGLADCDLTNKSLQWDSTTGRFSCATINGTTNTGAVITIGDSRYVKKQGDTMTGTLVINPESGYALNARGTISGALITQNGGGTNYFRGNVSIGSGASTTNGLYVTSTSATDIPTAFINAKWTNNSAGPMTALRVNASETLSSAVDAKLLDLQYNGTTVFYVTKGGNLVGPSSSRYSFGTAGYIENSGNNTSIYGYDGVTIKTLSSNNALVVTQAGRVAIGGTGPKAQLDVKGSMSGASLYISRSMSGAGLTDCDATSSILRWDSTTSRFSCATGNVTTEVGSASFSGAVQRVADSRYVKKQGDTMTGALAIRPTAGAGIVGLNVAAVMSGRSLYISGTGSAPLLATDISTGRLGIGTSAPTRATEISSTTGAILRLSRNDTAVGLEEVIGAIEFWGNDSGVGAGVKGGIEFRSSNSAGTTYDLIFNTAKSNALRIDHSGNVGVNTEDPDAFRPSGMGTASADRVFAVHTAGSSNDSALIVSNSNQTNGIAIWQNGGIGNYIDVLGSNAFELRMNAASTPLTALHVNAVGKVGLGTSTPGSRLAVSGSVIIGSNIGNAQAQTGVALEVIGTVSGSVLRAQNTLASSGTLVWEGAASGSSLYVATSINGAGLTDCDLTSSTLRWDATSGRFSCGSIPNEVGTLAFTGAVQRIGDQRWVNVAGDTMTGQLVISLSSGFVGLNVKQTISGSTLYASTALRSSGTLVVENTLIRGSGAATIIQKAENATGAYIYSSGTVLALDAYSPTGFNKHILFGYRGVFDTNLYRSASSTLKTDGSLYVMSHLSGATFGGAGLTDCDAASQKLEWDASTNKFSCGSIPNEVGTLAFTGAVQRIGDQRWVNVAGDTMTGQLVISLSSGFVGLNVKQTISGSTLYASTALRSSGTLVVENTLIRGSGAAAIIQKAENATGAYIYSSGTVLALDAYSPTGFNKHILFGYRGVFDTNLYRSASSTLKTDGSLIVLNAVSGAYLHAEKSLTSSGLLVWEGAGSGKSLTVSDNLAVGRGPGTYELEVNGTIRLQKTGAAAAVIAERLDGHMVALVGGGANPAIAFESGATFTIVPESRDRIESLNIASTPAFAIMANGNTGIGTTTPRAKLEVNGAMSGARLFVASSMSGAGLTDCDAASQVLKWDATTERFSCGTASTSSYNSGNVLAIGDARYVKKSGDTMTGALTINVTSGNNSTLGLNVLNTISGSIVKAAKTLASSGTLAVESNGYFGGQLTVTNVIKAISTDATEGGQLILSHPNDSTGLEANAWNIDNHQGELRIFHGTAGSAVAGMIFSSGGSVGIGSGFGTPKAKLAVAGTISGSALYITGTGASSKPILMTEVATGRVGIGTNDPNTSLSVFTTALNDGIYWFGQTADLRIYADGDNPTWAAMRNSIGSGILLYGGADDVGLSVSRLTSNVGIKKLGAKAALDVAGTMSGRALYISNSMSGAGLTDCDAASQVLKWDATTERFSCGTASTSSYSSGNVLTIGDARYVKKSGDTMTGALTINVTSGNNSTLGLNVLNTVSGAILKAAKTLASSGTLVVDGATFLNGNTTIGEGSSQYLTVYARIASPLVPFMNSNYALGEDSRRWASVFVGGSLDMGSSGDDALFSYDTTNDYFSFDPDSDSTAEFVMLDSGRMGIGTTTPKALLDVAGSISGASLYVSTSMSGAGLTDCDAASSKLLWDSTTERFSCGTDSTAADGLDVGTADARYVKKQGDTMTGALTIRLSTGDQSTVGLNVISTISGAVIRAQKSLASSGSLVVEGATTLNGDLTIGTGNSNSITVYSRFASALVPSINGFYELGEDDYRWSTVLVSGSLDMGTSSDSGLFSYDATSDYFSFDPDSDSTAEFVMLDTGRMGIGTTTPKALLDVAGSISGATLYVSSSMSGAGLTDCDAASSVLRWDSTTERFSCGTATTTAEVGTASFSGAVQRVADSRYVNTAGDTMTGALMISNTSNSDPLLKLHYQSTAVGAGPGISFGSSDVSTIIHSAIRGIRTSSSVGGLAFYTANGDATFAGLEEQMRILGTGNVGIDVPNPGSRLSVSGSVIIGNAIGSAAAKAQLDVRGTVSGAALYITGSMSGAGLTDCDAASSVLRWDSTTERFSCGTASTTAEVGTGSFSGAVLRVADSRYVNTSGDTMTGALTIRPTGGVGIVGLNVAAVMSGRSLYITGTGSRPQFMTDVSTGRIGVGTSTPQRTMHLYGSGANVATALAIATSGGMNSNQAVLELLTRGMSNEAIGSASVRGWQIGARGNSFATAAQQNDLYFSYWDGSSFTNAMQIDSTTGYVNIGGSFAPETALEVLGTVSGSALHLSDTIEGAGLTDCSASDSKLLWNATTKRFSCGTDQTGSGSSGGGTYLAPVIATYKTADETLASNTTLQNDDELSFSIGANETWTFRFVVHGQSNATPDFKFAVTAPAGATCNYGFSSAYSAATSGGFGCGVSTGAVPGSNVRELYEISGVIANGSTAGTVRLQWAQNISALGDTTVFAGSFVQAIKTGISTQSAFGTGNAITLGDSRYVNTSGDTMTGKLTINVTGGNRNTLALNVLNTISGAVVHAEKTLASSGNLVVENSISGASLYVATSINGAGLTDCDAASSVLRWDATTGRFSCGTASTSSYNSGNVLAIGDARYVKKSGDTMTGALTINVTGGNNATLGLNVLNTVSGAILKAAKTLTSSGTLVWEGAASGASLYIASSLQGAGLVDCDVAGTSKLLWDATTGRFSCGTDQTGGGGTSFGSGNVFSIGDARYVKKSGDTMTGALTIRLSTGNQSTVGLNVISTISGAVIRAAKTLSSSGTIAWEGAGSGQQLTLAGGNIIWSRSGATVFNELGNNVDVRMEGDTNAALFYLDASTDRIGIGTAAPKTRFDVVGTMSGTTMVISRSAVFAGSGVIITSSGAVVFNEQSRNVDFRIEGDTNTALFMADASTDRIGIGTAAPKARFDVVGTMSGTTMVLSRGAVFAGSGVIITSSGAAVFNEKGNNVDFRIEGDRNQNLFVADARGTVGTSTASGAIGIGTRTPLALLHVAGVVPQKEFAAISVADDLDDIAVHGQHMYAVSGDYDLMHIYSISNPSSIESLISIGGEVLDDPRAVRAQGQYVYVVNNGTDTLKIIDVSDPLSPTVVGSIATADDPTTLAVQGRYAYVGHAAAGSFRIYDISNPAVPVLLSTYGIERPILALFVQGNYLYVTSSDFAGTNEINTYNVSNPTNPQAAMIMGTSYVPSGIYVQDRYAYVTRQDNDQIEIIDVKTPSSYVNGTALTVGDAPKGVFVQGKYLFVTNHSGSSLQIVDVNSPAAPVSLGSVRTVGRPKTVVVQGRYAFVATEVGNVQVFDVGGAYIQQFEAGGAEVATLNVRNLLQAHDGSFYGALNVSESLNVAGPGSFGQGLKVISTLKVGSGALTVVAAEHQTGSYVYGSGAAVSALDAYTNTGSRTPHLLFGYRGTFDVGMYRIGRAKSGALAIRTDNTFSNNSASVFEIYSNAGHRNNKVFRVATNGSTFADGSYNSTGADYAEWFFSTDKLKAGEVVCIDVTRNNAVKRCARGADTNLMGIVSTNPAFIGNQITGADGLMPPGYYLIGLIGQVPAKVTSEGGEIRPGDSLTSASKAGYARKAAAGESTVGVALEGMNKAEGTVNVLISRRNQSLTVEAVEDKILKSISAMQIEDEVQLMVSSALGDLNVDQQISTEVERQLANMESQTASIEAIRSELAWLKQELERVKSQTGATTVITTQTGGFTRASSLEVDGTLTTGDSARIGGDLHIDGALTASSLVVPNGLSIQGGVALDGLLDTTELRVSSGAVIDGLLTVNGGMAFGTGSFLDLREASVYISELVVDGSLFVMGDVTIEGLATFLKDVEIKGELIVSNKQAGFAMIPRSGTSVTVNFGTGFTATPVVTASPDVPVLYAVSKTTATGFTLRLAGPAPEDVTFSWHALSVGAPLTIRTQVTDEGTTVFPLDTKNIPVSSIAAWNACIRNIPMFDAEGKPLSCARFHDGYTWMHPDLGISFIWNTSMTPAYLKVPDGYEPTVTESAASVESVFGSDADETEAEAASSSSASSLDEADAVPTSVSSAAPVSSSSSSVISLPASSAGSSVVSESSASSITVTPVEETGEEFGPAMPPETSSSAASTPAVTEPAPVETAPATEPAPVETTPAAETQAAIVTE